MLEKEKKLFAERLPSLLQERAGQFVLIKKDTVDIYPNEQEAINAGLRKYGASGSFFIGKISSSTPKISIPALSLGIINANI